MADQGLDYGNIYAPSATSNGSAYYVSTPSQTPGATQNATGQPDEREAMFRKYQLMRQLFGGSGDMRQYGGGGGASGFGAASVGGGLSSGLQSGMNTGMSLMQLKNLFPGGLGGG